MRGETNGTKYRREGKICSFLHNQTRHTYTGFRNIIYQKKKKNLSLSQGRCLQDGNVITGAVSPDHDGFLDFGAGGLYPRGLLGFTGWILESEGGERVECVCGEREGRRFLDQEFLQFIVEYKHEGATSTSQHVGESSLEEGAGTWGEAKNARLRKKFTMLRHTI